MTETYLIALTNAAICVAVIVILLCRLNAMGGSLRVRFAVRVAHALGVGAMMCSMLRPMINEWPGYASLLVDAYVLMELWSSRSAWRGIDGDHPPDSAITPLETT